MNQNSPKGFLVNLSTIQSWLFLAALIWLLGLVGLGWLVKSFLVLVGLILIAPVIVFLGIRWWFQRNLVQDQCPVCAYQFSGLNETRTRCPNCSELVKIERRHFTRLTPPGTIDVQAVEVAAKTTED